MLHIWFLFPLNSPPFPSSTLFPLPYILLILLRLPYPIHCIRSNRVSPFDIAASTFSDPLYTFEYPRCRPCSNLNRYSCSKSNNPQSHSRRGKRDSRTAVITALPQRSNATKSSQHAQDVKIGESRASMLLLKDPAEKQPLRRHRQRRQPPPQPQRLRQ